MVHQNNAGAYLVFGVVFDGKDPETSTTAASATLANMFTHMATTTGTTTAIDLGNFVVEDSGHYDYDGSFTTPPCTEGVQWIVQATPVSIKQSQINAFWDHIGGYPGNARDVQPLNTRSITYNVDATTFTYQGDTGPALWATLKPSYSVCATGVEQSPINIDALNKGYSLTTSEQNPVKDFISTVSSATYDVTQSHHAPLFTCHTTGRCGSVNWNGVSFKLVQVHFHTPSEHTINGVKYGMALHFVHQSTAGAYLVFGVVFDGKVPETSSTDSSTTLASMFTHMASTTGTTTAIDLGNFVVEDSGHYDYDGSFTTPPCTEGVQWIVQATPVSVKQSQIDAFWDHIGGYPGNARNTQPLSGRTIAFNVDKSSNSSKQEVNPWLAAGVVFIILFGLVAAFVFYKWCVRGSDVKTNTSGSAKKNTSVNMPYKPRLVADGISKTQFDAMRRSINNEEDI